MARAKRYQPLDVYLNSRLVGQLRRKTSGAIEFQYDAEWLAWPYALPVSLSLPLRESLYAGSAVLAVFENLLPDNDAIRQRIAARTHAQGADAYSLLAAIGHDCVGALQFLPAATSAAPGGSVEGIPVSDEEIAAMIANLGRAPLGVSEDDSFRISIAGAQEKTALLRWNGQWYKPLGTTATTHILKPSIGRLQNGINLDHSVENEYLCLKLLEALNLPVAKAEIMQFGNRRVLVVERFDRTWRPDHKLLRLPQEDCCQALSVLPSLKYESDGGPGIVAILRLLQGSDDPSRDRRVFLKAMIAFWLLGASDGHAKNFSIFLAPGERFRMTPLYDVISAQPVVDAGHISHNRFKLAMAVGDRRHYVVKSILPRHFMQTARAAGLGRDLVTEIFDELRESAPGAIEKTRAALPAGFPAQLAASVGRGVEDRLRLLASSDTD